MFNKYIGLEFGAAYHHGLPTSSLKIIYTDTLYMGKEERNHDGLEKKIRADMVNLSFSVMMTPSFEKWNPYLKFGIIVNVGRAIQQENIEIYKPFLAYGDYDYSEKHVSHIKMSGFGFIGALGVMYKVNPFASMFAEWQFSCINSLPLYGKYTVYEVNGRDVLPSLSTQESRWSYSTKNSKENERFKHNYPFSSTGIQIGVKFQF